MDHDQMPDVFRVKSFKIDGMSEEEMIQLAMEESKRLESEKKNESDQQLRIAIQRSMSCIRMWKCSWCGQPNDDRAELCEECNCDKDTYGLEINSFDEFHKQPSEKPSSSNPSLQPSAPFDEAPPQFLAQPTTLPFHESPLSSLPSYHPQSMRPPTYVSSPSLLSYPPSQTIPTQFGPMPLQAYTVPSTTGDLTVSILSAFGFHPNQQYIHVEVQKKVPVGDLYVTVHNAKDLFNTQVLTKQDPYCIVKLGNQILNSNIHDDGGKNPVWNHEFRFDLTGSAGEQRFFLELWNKNILSDDMIGKSYEMPLSSLIALAGKENKVMRLGRDYRLKTLAGYATISVRFQPSPDQGHFLTKQEGSTMKATASPDGGIMWNEAFHFKYVSSDSFILLSLMEPSWGKDKVVSSIRIPFKENVIKDAVSSGQDCKWDMSPGSIFVQMRMVNLQFPYGVVPIAMQMPIGMKQQNMYQ